jgi:hypothetical protein
MNVDEKYFKNITDRERAIFEGAITMGALFHQFVGTPVSIESAPGLEKSIENAMELQPCIESVNIKISKKMLEDSKSKFEYTALSGEMMDIKIISKYDDKKAVIRMKFIEGLNYPLMYVEEADK